MDNLVFHPARGVYFKGISIVFQSKIIYTMILNTDFKSSMK